METNEATAPPAPALWNPNAASLWSILLSPVFGAYLQMLNWKALGKPEEASTSWTWVRIGIGLIVFYFLGGVFFAGSKAMEGFTNIIGLVFLISWYLMNGRRQVKFVKQHHGDDYPRQPWNKPLLIALGCFVALFVVGFIVGFFSAMFGGGTSTGGF